MAYLLDSNILIQAKNEYYGFDLCPGFWEWLEQCNRDGKVFSIDRVGDELKRGSDQLADWAASRGDGFFLPLDAPAHQAMANVAKMVQDGGFKPHARHHFLSGGGADPFLIAYAIAHDHTVVSHEIHVEGMVRQVKIPTICLRLGVPYIRAFEMLRKEKVRFVLPSRS